MNAKDVENLIDKYIIKLKSDKKSPNTISSYKTGLNSMLKYIEDNYDDDIELKSVVMEYVDSFGSDLKAGSINTKRAAIRAFITYLSERDYIKEDFSGNIKNIKNNPPIKEILEPGEIKMLLNHLIEELKIAEGYDVYFKARNLTLIIFMLYTGTRRGELVKVKFDDIDFMNNEIRVVGKGNKPRIIPLMQELKEYLYNFRDIIEKLQKAGYNAKSEYLFRSERRNYKTKEKDSPMTPRNVLKLVKKLCVESGITKNITAHTIRHIFASYAIQNNMNIRALSDILGHSSTSTTVNIYAHVISNEIKKNEMQKLEY